MKRLAGLAALALAALASPTPAQDDGGDDSGIGEVIVTAQRISAPKAPAERRPVIGLKRRADSAARRIEIVSDSREQDLRQREVQAMLLSALDMAKREGLSLVTGQFEVTEVTRDNWRELFPGLAAKSEEDDEEEDDEDYDDDDDEDNRPKPSFEDDGNTATARLRIKTKLTGTIAEAERRISAFAKKVPKNGRSLIEQKGGLALTIVNPEQYRDDIYRRIAAGAKHASEFYGADYGLTMTGLDREIAWEQVSNTEVFLYVPYSFTVSK